MICKHCHRDNSPAMVALYEGFIWRFFVCRFCGQQEKTDVIELSVKNLLPGFTGQEPKRHYGKERG